MTTKINELTYQEILDIVELTIPPSSQSEKIARDIWRKIEPRRE